MGIYGLDKTNGKKNVKQVEINVRETKSTYILTVMNKNIKIEHKITKTKFKNEPYKCISYYLIKDFIVNSIDAVEVYTIKNDKTEILFTQQHSIIKSIMVEDKFIESIQSTIKTNEEIKTKKDIEVIDISIVKNKTEYKIKIKDSKKYIRKSMAKFEAIPYKSIVNSLYKLGIHLDTYKVRFDNIDLFIRKDRIITDILEEKSLLSIIPVNIKNQDEIKSEDSCINVEIKNEDSSKLFIDSLNKPSDTLNNIDENNYKSLDIDNENDNYDNIIPSFSTRVIEQEVNNITPLDCLNIEFLKLLIEEYDKQSRTESVSEFYISDEFQNKIKEIQMIIRRFNVSQYNIPMQPMGCYMGPMVTSK